MRKKTPCFLTLTLTVACWILPAKALEPTYEVNLLVAYDEEWACTAYWRYAYSAQTLAHIMIDSGFYYLFNVFGVDYLIVEYVNWNSDNSLNTQEALLNEAIDETGFYSGMYVSGMRVDVLVAFTDQETPDAYGISDKVLGAVLITETYEVGVWQATENVLQHELSHLYYAAPPIGHDHFEDGVDCVMNSYPQWSGIHHVPTCFFTNNWCNACENTIMSHRALWGKEESGGGGGFLWRQAW